ncbi:MAG: polysaccharide deacetylase family protein [Burkholderiales bacterium]|nr:polysaccharide deacetylase family protein [Burkholderiales bacterium]
MDADLRLPYSPIVARPRFAWPGGARVAIWVVPNVEHYEYQPAQVRVRDPWPRQPHPDVLNYGIRDYGNRVGLWRMLEVLDRHRIRCTASLSMAVLDMYPEIAAAMAARGWEYMSHGLYNTRYHWNYSEDEERAAIAACQAIHRRHTGRDLAGWFSPAASYTLNTADLVAAAGIRYLCDFFHDDQPCEIAVRSGRLVSVPYGFELNDSVMHRRPLEGEDFERMGRAMFDELHENAGRWGGLVMAIGLHPYVMGAPHRIGHLDRLLAYLKGRDGVWWATGAEIADHWMAAHPR